MLRRILYSTLIVILLSVVAHSHDYWLEPESFFVPVGDSVNVRMYMGQHLTSEEERPFKTSATIKFEILSAADRHDLIAEAKDGEVPVARPTFNQSGNYLVAMERKAQTIALLSEKFTEYLTEEGLDGVIEERMRSGEANLNGRERYHRYLKTLVQVGAKHTDANKAVVGQRLEIVPLDNPYQLRIGARLKVLVLFAAAPLRNATVFADNRSDGTVYTQPLKTSSDGTIIVMLDRPGTWLIRLVHMQRCVKCDDADWESFWAAFSFGMKG